MDTSDKFLIFLGAFVTSFLVVLLVTVLYNSVGYYEYETIDGYSGVATNCYNSYGIMYCTDEDGATISVVKYKKVR